VHDPRVEIYRQMEVERPAARLLGVEVYLPRLTHRVGFDEVPFVVDVKLMVNGVVFDVGHEAWNIDDGQFLTLRTATARF